MKALRILLALAATLFPAPALADVTAHYGAGENFVTVEAADNGDSRFEIDAAFKFAIIRHDGVDYAVTADANGVDRIARADAVMVAMFGSAGHSGPQPRFDTIMGAPDTLAGYSGTLWTFGPQGEQPGELLMSPDPRLVPVGNVFRQLVALLSGAAGMDVDADAFRQLFARGTPLRITSLEASGPALLIMLKSVDYTAIDPARFALPGPVIPAEDFMKLLPSPAPASTVPRID